MDIFPTVCELIGRTVPEGLDGRSLAPVVAGKERRVRDSLFSAYRQCQRAVRDDRWKLIPYPLINKTQLFDLKTDPHEMRDLSDDPVHAGRMERMMTQLADWQRRLEDDQPLTSENPASSEVDIRALKQEAPRKKKR